MLIALLVSCPVALGLGSLPARSPIQPPVEETGEKDEAQESPTRAGLAPVAPAPRLEVLEGRALVFGERGFSDVPRGPYGKAGAGGYLELGPAARIELAWSGLGSAQILGPAAIEWAADAEGAPYLYIWFADRVELDVRRGTFGLNYAGRVVTDARRGALSLREVPGGLRVRHHGGEAGLLWCLEPDGEEGRWRRRTLASGAQ